MGCWSMSSATTWPRPCWALAWSSASKSVVSIGAVANIDCTISSARARLSAARRARPVTPSGDTSRRGGSTVMRTRGNRRRGTLPPRRENGVNSTPSMRTRSSAASVRSAMTAGPSYTFISEPVVVRRPSGKITHADPPSTARIIARIDSGFAGSTGMASTSARNGRAHHRVAMSVSTAKIGRPGRNAPSSSASRNDAWLAAMTACGMAARACSRPSTWTR